MSPLSPTASDRLFPDAHFLHDGKGQGECSADPAGADDGRTFSLLIGNKTIDISHTQNFDVAAFRADLKKRMNERLGGDYVADVLIEQLDYLSKEETHGGESVGKRTVKPVKIVQDAAKDKVPVE